MQNAVAVEVVPQWWTGISPNTSEMTECESTTLKGSREAAETWDLFE